MATETAPAIWSDKSPVLVISPDGEAWPQLNDGATFTDKVEKASSAGKTIIEYYTKYYGHSGSLAGWLRRIENGQIELNGFVVRDPQEVLKIGDLLSYHRKPWREAEAPCKVRILYEDNHLLVLAKPSGLQVVRGGAFHQRTVLTLLQRHHQLQAGASAVENKELLPECQQASADMNSDSLSFPGADSGSGPALLASPVHRLGRGTSGVLMCPKSSLAKGQLSADFSRSTSEDYSRSKAVGRRSRSKALVGRCIAKTYRALATGVIGPDEVLIEQPIGKVKYPGVAGGLYMATDKGKPSKSRVRVYHRDLEAGTTVVEVDLHTGRAHQIRIHLACIGHPLVGDPLYGAGGVPLKTLAAAGSGTCEMEDEGLALLPDGGHARPDFGLPGDCGYLLHSLRLTFTHPATCQRMEVTAAPPPQLCSPDERPEHFLPSWRCLEHI